MSEAFNPEYPGMVAAIERLQQQQIAAYVEWLDQFLRTRIRRTYRSHLLSSVPDPIMAEAGRSFQSAVPQVKGRRHGRSR